MVEQHVEETSEFVIDLLTAFADASRQSTSAVQRKLSARYGSDWPCRQRKVSSRFAVALIASEALEAVMSRGRISMPNNQLWCSTELPPTVVYWIGRPTNVALP